MPDVIDFKEAMKRTDGEDRALLIGNGFSAQYFSYRNLLEKSGLSAEAPVRKIFDALGTVDFEAVVHALDGAVLVERTYGNTAHADELEDDAKKVRDALVEAVNSTHPPHREDLGDKYTTSAGFLANFSTVYTLNYDLLLYWVNLEKRLLKDGFGLGSQIGAFHGPFDEEAYCHLYNMHGGLHLFEDADGDIMKAIDTGSGVISTITDTISKLRRFPIYVAEGTSAQKMSKINSVSYLRHCYEILSRNSAVIFIYGHSADENDAHIYRAVFGSETKHIYFGVYNPNEDTIKRLDGLLSKYQKTSGSTAEYTFFDSESAKIWEA